MFEYYISLATAMPAAFIASIQTFSGFVATIGFFLLLFQPPWVQSLGRRLMNWDEISRWWAIVPVSILFAYSVLGQNFSQISRRDTRIDELEQRLYRPFVSSRPVPIPKTGEMFRSLALNDTLMIDLFLEIENTSDVQAGVVLPGESEKPLKAVFYPEHFMLGPKQKKLVRVEILVDPSIYKDQLTAEGIREGIAGRLNLVKAEVSIKYQSVYEAVHVFEIAQTLLIRGDRLDIGEEVESMRRIDFHGPIMSWHCVDESDQYKTDEDQGMNKNNCTIGPATEP